MNVRHTPYGQIARVLLRSVNLQDARWLFFVIVCFVGFAVVSVGISTGWELGAVTKAVIGTVVFCLQFAGVGAFTVLMRLNHAVASRLVPGYVVALRLSALAIWLTVCVLTGFASMLDGGARADVLLLAFIAGAAMLLISTPLRWPVRWCLSLVGLAWFVREGVPYLLSGPHYAPATVRLGLTTVAVLIYISMAWLVTRMIADKGSPYAALFSRFLAAQQAERMMDKPSPLSFNRLSLWRKAYRHVALWMTLPWVTYARHVLANPKLGPANAVARAELGFGPVVHWVTQASLSLAFASVLTLVWWSNPALLTEGGESLSPLLAFYIALVSLACAATSVLSIGDVMLRTQGEQKLMLLLPTLPQGNSLTRILAARHLRQAFAAWALATVWTLLLPYPDSISNYVSAVCWGTLPLVPLVAQDWAALRPPEALRSVGRLVLGMLVPFSAWAALRWLHVPVESLAAVALGACVLVLWLRWRHVAHGAQALPVGRLA